MNRLLPARMLAALRPEAAAHVELPGDVLRRARRRVRVAALLGLGAYTAFLVFELSGLPGGTPLERSIDLAHDAIGLAVCLALWAVAASPRASDRAAIGATLVAEFLLCALISATVPWASFVRMQHAPGITWVVPILIMAPLLVPFSANAARIVSVASAMTMPLGLAMLAGTDRIEVRAADVWASALTAGVGAGIALIAARAIRNANRQSAAARAAGSYFLTEPIARGGMGDVWKAEHTLLARAAAVKRILPERLQGAMEQRDAAVARFTREARLTASLRSPHTVALHDFGETAEGALYYAMELLDGTNFEHFVYRHGPIGQRRAIHWLGQVCHSLGEAHARGLVHRDIKPGNLMVCHHGRDRDFVKVLDFGLTRPVEVTVAEAVTLPGVRLGTPGYMAPEQILGQPPDARSDLYAVGCVAYWLVAGARLFEAETSAELMRLHVSAPPPVPASRAPHPLTDRFERLILACIAKDPRDRPQDADELRAELAACADGNPWTADEARAWWERNGG